MLVVVERVEELLKSTFVHGLVNCVLVVDKSALGMKIDELLIGYGMMMAAEISVIEGGTRWCLRSWNEKLKR